MFRFRDGGSCRQARRRTVWVMRRFTGIVVGAAAAVGALVSVSGQAVALAPPPPAVPGPGEMAVTRCLDVRLVCHEVVEGEWLWQLARLSVPDALPVRPVLTDDVEIARRVDDLRARNRAVLRGSDTLRPGQVLVVGERVMDEYIDLSCDQVLPPLAVDDSGSTVRVQRCTSLSVSLEECSSCGYEWRIVTAPDQAVLTGPTKLVLAPPETGGSPQVGGSDAVLFNFRSVEAGRTSFRLGYFPPAGDVPKRTFDLDVIVG